MTHQRWWTRFLGLFKTCSCFALLSVLGLSCCNLACGVYCCINLWTVQAHVAHEAFHLQQPRFRNLAVLHAVQKVAGFWEELFMCAKIDCSCLACRATHGIATNRLLGQLVDSKVSIVGIKKRVDDSVNYVTFVVFQLFLNRILDSSDTCSMFSQTRG